MPSPPLHPDAAVTYASPCLSDPRRTLAEVRLDLIARRLDLLRRQLDAKNIVAQLGRDIDDVTARLRAIDEAEAA